MADVSWIWVLGGTIMTFLLGGAYYAVFGGRVAELSEIDAKMGPVTFVVEILRCLVLAGAVAVLAPAVGADSWVTGLTLGLGLWVAFPAVLWAGAVVHAKTPPALALIHAGDWLVKLAALGILYGAVG